jgi:methionine salvage enolase-phosphatase E1|tara:strand:+ start:351 stop:533 length:183 start_codon:yes stop_codon:yes gene_type:complete
MTEQDYLNITEEITLLKKQKSFVSDFEEEMNLADKIHNLEMKRNGVKPEDTYIDCIGCGS